MAKGIIDLIFDSIFDSEWKGRHGEQLTERKLKWIKFFGRDGKILRNVYLPKDNGETSEVDIIFITPKGIFVFESKNYSGWIFGDEKGVKWTTVLPNRHKNYFYNPIMQNKTHIKWLKEYVGKDIPMFSIIVFSERCELKKVSVFSDDVWVIKRDKTNATVKRICDSKPDVLSEDDIDNIYNKLSGLTNVDEAVKMAHIEAIENKHKTPGSSYRNSDASMDVVEQCIYSESVEVCPRCGGKLVLRTAKRGANIGRHFYGCSEFPKCRYTRQ